MELQNSGMLSRDQLLFLFDRFSSLTSLPEVKKRIADAVNDKQKSRRRFSRRWELTPSLLDCLGRVSLSFDDDQDLMIQFYGFVAKEEIASEQLEMLKHMRKFQLDDQSAILEKIHQQMENAGQDV
ncbi:hypothetical protein OROMI_012629 [Orobanche minor]